MTGDLFSATPKAEDQPETPPPDQPPAGEQINSSEFPSDITVEHTPIPTTKTTDSRKRKRTTLQADQQGLPDTAPAPAQANVTIPTETNSERKAFIKKFGAEKGLTAPVLESIWQARKHGYHKPYDAPFSKFRAFFMDTRPLSQFCPDTILPGDVIGFLRKMQEDGSNHGSIKDASASISTAVSQATDGAINIGKKESVIAFLKSVRIHQPMGPRRKRIPDGYGDVARLYEEAWSFGPNDALCNRHLQDKLVLLLMLDTAARPSDLQHLYRITEGSQRQILFSGKDMQIRYFYSKEVDPGSARQNSSST